MNKSFRALRTMRQGHLEQMDEDMQNPALLGPQSQQKWCIQSFVGARKRCSFQSLRDLPCLHTIHDAYVTNIS